MKYALLMFYETSLLLISMVIASWVHSKTETRDKSVFVPIINAFGTKICLCFFLPFLITSLKLNEPRFYFFVALFISAFVFVAFVKNPSYLTTIPSSINRFLCSRKNLILVSLFLVFGPVIFINIGPPQEFDSLLVINNLYDWSNNSLNPFEGYHKYGVITWEIGFLPSFVITKTDYFWCWINFQVLFLITIASIFIARRLQIGALLATLSVIASLSLYHFWFYPGNFGIKSDIALCAGVLLVYLGLSLISERKNDIESVLMLSLGAAFMLTKEMGPLLLCGELLLFCIVHMCSIPLSRFVGIFKGILFVSLPVAGHEYLRNLFVHGNPVYPLPVKIGFLALPGNAIRTVRSISGTSIISNIDNDQVWAWWLGIGLNHYPVGILLPYLIFAIIGLSVYRLGNYLRKKNAIDWTFLAWYTTITWGIYFFLPLTAASPSGDFIFIAQLRSMRYNLGGVILIEIFAISLLNRKHLFKDAGAYLFVFANLIYRIYLLYFYVPTNHFGVLNFPDAQIELYIEGTVLLATAMLVIIMLPKSMRGAGTLVLLFSLLISSPYIFERNRHLVSDRWNPIKNVLAENKGTSVFLISTLGNKGDKEQVPYIYAAVGNHFQNTVDRGDISSLSARCTENNAPNYVGIISSAPGLVKSDIDEVTMHLNKFGYYKIDSNEWSAIYERRL
ncbi:MAG: hypothetical protein A2464_04000 [Deltaproteobacteria bacterium RIFOXYC2_FULL_48_10]|nr:MAG: hypothetical protein A2464_04000 [Deltaproteobacteria bacterium RIFOXYC2_FULL_48_10]